MADRSESPALGISSPEPEPLTGANKSLKRKETSDGTQTVSKRAAKRKRKAAAAGPSAFDEIDEELHVNPAIARMDGALLADHVARQTKRFEKDISVVELEDRRIPGASASRYAASSVGLAHIVIRAVIVDIADADTQYLPFTIPVLGKANEPSSISGPSLSRPRKSPVRNYRVLWTTKGRRIQL